MLVCFIAFSLISLKSNNQENVNAATHSSFVSCHIFSAFSFFPCRRNIFYDSSAPTRKRHHKKIFRHHQINQRNAKKLFCALLDGCDVSSKITDL